MAATYRGKLPKPTSRGDVRPEIAGKRFTVGNIRDTTQTQMLTRLNTLRDVFVAQSQMFKIDHWDKWLIPFAQEFGRSGVIMFRVHQSAEKIPGLLMRDVTAFEMLRSLGLPVETQDNAVLDTGVGRWQRVFDEQIQNAIADAVADIKGQKLAPTLMSRISVELHGKDHRSFHDALNAYKKHIRLNGRKNDLKKLALSPKNYLKWTDKIKSVHVDFPLVRLDLSRLQKITAYWRNREYRYTIKGVEKPIGRDYAGHIMQCLWSFLKWLSDDPDWQWKIPAGANSISRKIEPLDSDLKKRRARRIQGTVYNPEQLAEIATRLNTFQKMFLGLSVNCAMQPAESGRVETGDYYTVHPETGKNGDFIIFDRPKTFEYGEWVLWPEVAELVKWGVDRSKRLGCDRLLVTDKGKDWYKDHSAQPATTMSKWWQAIPTKASKHIGIVTRMNREDPNFPRYPIKNLRKILPSIIRPRWGKELADLVNARKIANNGVLNGAITDRYGDRPYDPLADVLTELQSEFRPFLDALRF